MIKLQFLSIQLYNLKLFRLNVLSRFKTFHDFLFHDPGCMVWHWARTTTASKRSTYMTFCRRWWMRYLPSNVTSVNSQESDDVEMERVCNGFCPEWFSWYCSSGRWETAFAPVNPLWAWPRFDIILISRYKVKTDLRPSYLYNGVTIRIIRGFYME